VRNADGRLAIKAFGCEFLYRDTHSSRALEQIEHFGARTTLAAAQQESPQTSTARSERLAHRVDADQHLVAGPLPFATRSVSRARLHAAFSRPGSRLVCGSGLVWGSYRPRPCAAYFSRAA